MQPSLGGCQGELACRVLDPGVFLQPLADRFMRLVLQLLARYTSWLAAGLQQSESTPLTPQEGSAEQARHSHHVAAARWSSVLTS